MAAPITVLNDFLPLRTRAFFSYTGLVVADTVGTCLTCNAPVLRTAGGDHLFSPACIDGHHEWTDAPVVLRGTLEGSDGLA